MNRFKEGLPGIEVIWTRSFDSVAFVVLERRIHLGRDRGRDFILHLKDILQVAVPFLGPQVMILFGINQLGGDPYPLTALADTALDDITHPELLGDVLEVHTFVFVGKA